MHNEFVRLCRQGEFEKARDLAHSILKAYPDYIPTIQAYQSLGNNTGNVDLMIEAASFYEAIGQDPLPSLLKAFSVDQLVCDWKHRDYLIETIARRFRALLPWRWPRLAILAAIDDPELHRAVALCFTNDVLMKTQGIPAKQERRQIGASGIEKIRIGYVSNDFRSHPMARVLTGLIENHDREHFEIFAYDYSTEDGSTERQRFKKAFDTMRQIKALSAHQCASLITSDKIDVLIDLKGYTLDPRPEIFALKAAPIQINFMGYPSTLAAPWIDYVIADASVIPVEQRHIWSEAVAYMPGCYYLCERENDPIEQKSSLRAEMGLPSSSFVFGNFNNPFKITPEIFDLWLCILAQVPSSVLWLYNRTQFSQDNLKNKADLYGVDRNRIIFVDYAERVEHLRRYQAMDLFLDTRPYNAHTTAVEALNAGVPVLTWPGQSFASRVCKSILESLGLGQLVVESAEEYVEAAVAFAQDPPGLALLSQEIQQRCRTGMVFDAKRYAKHFEELIRSMIDIHNHGERPRDIGASP